MIPVKQRNSSFLGNTFSYIVSVYLGVTGMVNVILLLPGLDSLRESVYSMEMDIFHSMFVVTFKFRAAFIFAFI